MNLAYYVDAFAAPALYRPDSCPVALYEGIKGNKERIELWVASFGGDDVAKFALLDWYEERGIVEMVSPYTLLRFFQNRKWFQGRGFAEKVEFHTPTSGTLTCLRQRTVPTTGSMYEEHEYPFSIHRMNGHFKVTYRGITRYVID